MPSDPELSLLARAYVQKLVSLEEVSDVLRDLGRNDSASLSRLLRSHGLLSGEPSDGLLISQTLDAAADAAHPLSSPDGWNSAGASGPRSGRGSTYKPEETEVTQDFAGNRSRTNGSARESTELESRQQFIMMGELGRGGLGRVRVGYDRQIAREVAVKELLPQSLQSPDKVKRFLREARVTGQLEHPGIVPIYATGNDASGNPFYAMKRIGGRPLLQAIHEFYALPPDDPSRPRRFGELLMLFANICQTMAFVHQRGVLHRDLKPQNILIGDFGEAIVVDWGLAKYYRNTAEAGPEETTLADADFPAAQSGSMPASIDDTLETRLGTVVGTIAYMSPEQALGHALDARADIYSLGAILFEIITGEPPFRGKGSVALEQIRQRRIPDPLARGSSVSKPLAAVCRKAMAADPIDRYPSAKDLAEEIARWQAGDPPVAYHEPWLERGFRWVKRHRTLCQVVAASIAVFALVFGAWSWQERRRVAQITERAEQHLQSAQKDYFGGELERASEEIAKAGAIAAAERRLQPMQREVEELRSQIAAQLQTKAETRQVREKQAEFQQAYDQALFHSLLAAQPGSGDDHRQALLAADRALGLFPLVFETQEGAATLPPGLAAADWQQLRNKQQELLFIKAELTAQSGPRPGEPGKPAEALAILGQLPSNVPLRAVHLRRARYLDLAGKRDEAHNQRQQASQIAAVQPLDLFILGDEHLRAEEFAAASSKFKQALARDPQRFWAQCFLAMAELQLGQFGQAIANLTACASRRPEFAWTYLLRGLAYGQQGDAEAAEADFQSALNRSRDSDSANRYAIFINRGIVRMRLGRAGAAAADFKTAIAIDPKRWEAIVNLAEAQRKRDDQHAMLAAMGMALAAPTAPVACVADCRESMSLLNQAVELAPAEPRPHLNRGILWRQLGDAARAATDFQTAAALAPSHSIQKAQALLELGRIAHHGQNLNEALRLYNAALAERPDHIDALYLRGLVQMDLNNAEEAIASLDQFLSRSNLAVQVYRSAQSGDQADGKPAVARKLDAGQPDPRLKLATLFRERALARMKLRDTLGSFHDSTLAVELIGPEWGELSPGDRDRFANLLDRRGWALLTQNAQLASASFDEAIRLVPDNADPYAGRGSALVQLGKYREAVADAQAALAKDPTNLGVLYNVASIYGGLAVQFRHDPDPPDDAAAEVNHWNAEAVRLFRACLETAPPLKRPFLLKQFEQDRTFDTIRDRPEVKRLVAKMWQTAPPERGR